MEGPEAWAVAMETAEGTRAAPRGAAAKAPETREAAAWEAARQGVSAAEVEPMAAMAPLAAVALAPARAQEHLAVLALEPSPTGSPQLDATVRARLPSAHAQSSHTRRHLTT